MYVVRCVWGKSSKSSSQREKIILCFVENYRPTFWTFPRYDFFIASYVVFFLVRCIHKNRFNVILFLFFQQIIAVFVAKHYRNQRDPIFDLPVRAVFPKADSYEYCWQTKHNWSFSSLAAEMHRIIFEFSWRFLLNFKLKFAMEKLLTFLCQQFTFSRDGCFPLKMRYLKKDLHCLFLVLCDLIFMKRRFCWIIFS